MTKISIPQFTMVKELGYPYSFTRYLSPALQ